MGYKEKFIEFMIASEALAFGDFVTKSGRKTPFFINTGSYKTGEQISLLGGFYADCIIENIRDGFDVLYGPAYKGIPLAVSAGIALFKNHGINIPYCFNRKEEKDHGEGGSLIGYKLKDGDRILIVEDVITAGTSLRESIPLLKAQAGVKIAGLIVSVNRMERGQGEKTALTEAEEEFGIKTMSIATIKDITAHLHGKKINGKTVLDDGIKKRIDEYMEQYGAKS
ncbi:MAG: orotate phosphoribosyltransferase [Spirochaetia bacterium]|jgi:orotate phosphoribosyltransferase|nr:orotate phosphoribosyltransferase [Spirochaetia bacterium]